MLELNWLKLADSVISNLNFVLVMARKFVNHCRKITKDCGISESSLLNGIHYIRCGKEYEMRRVIADLHGYLNRNRKVCSY